LELSLIIGTSWAGRCVLLLFLCRCPYIRVSFANPSAAECTEGILRLGTVLRNLRMQHKAQRDLDRTD
jgi:hypothetical protein